jgi:hypothetical protein
MLLNAVLNLVLEQKLDYLFSPIADFVLAQVASNRRWDELTDFDSRCAAPS